MKINKVFEVAIAVNDIKAATEKFRDASWVWTPCPR